MYLFEGHRAREIASEGLSCEPNLYMGKAHGPMFDALRSCALSAMSADLEPAACGPARYV